MFLAAAQCDCSNRTEGSMANSAQTLPAELSLLFSPFKLERRAVVLNTIQIVSTIASSVYSRLPYITIINSQAKSIKMKTPWKLN
jgi:hypothetical protein